MLAPIVYVVNTRWFSFAAQDPPVWTGSIGIAFLAPAIWLLLRAHADLDHNWSPALEIIEGHRLATDGIYGIICHAVYAAVWLTVIPQAVMIDRSGDEYRAYRGRTGVIPGPSKANG